MDKKSNKHTVAKYTHPDTHKHTKLGSWWHSFICLFVQLAFIDSLFVLGIVPYTGGCQKRNYTVLMVKLGFPGDSVAKNLPANAGDLGSIPESGRFPEKEMATTSVFFPRASYGQKGLAGHSPWSHKNWTQLSD